MKGLDLSGQAKKSHAQKKYAFWFTQLVAVVVLLLMVVCCWRSQDRKVFSKTPSKAQLTQAQDAPVRELHCVSNIQDEFGYRWKKQLIKEQLELFDFQHPSVKIVSHWETTTTVEGFIKRIIDNIQNNQTSLDVIPMNKRIYDSVAAGLADKDWGRKYLVDFAKIPGFVEAHKAEIFKINDLKLNTGSILTGPYLEGEYFCTWYNAALGEKIGLELSNSQLSFEKLLRCIEKINEYNEAAEEPVYAISSVNNDYCSRIMFLNLLLSSIVDEQGNLPQRVAPITQERAVLDALDQMRRLVALKPFVPLDVLNCSAYNVGETIKQKAAVHLNLINNRAVFFFSKAVEPGYYDLSPIALKTNGLHLLELPVLRPTNYSTGHFVASWAVLKNSPNVDEAIKLMQFWTQPEVAELWTQQSQNITCLNRTLYTASLKDNAFGQYIAQQEKDYGEKIVDLYSAVDSRFDQFDFSFHKTMRLVKQLSNPGITGKKIMWQFCKRNPSS